MSAIDTKDWSARINNMPSTQGPTLMVSGTVVVANSAITANLLMPALQDKSFGLRLELVLEEKGVGLAVLTDKAVSLLLSGHTDTTHVQIFHEGKELVNIDNIETVS